MGTEETQPGRVQIRYGIKGPDSRAGDRNGVSFLTGRRLTPWIAMVDRLSDRGEPFVIRRLAKIDELGASSGVIFIVFIQIAVDCADQFLGFGHNLYFFV
jgi:hypothetical protein